MSFPHVAQDLDAIRNAFGDLYEEAVADAVEFRGELTLVVRPEHIVKVCRALKTHPDLKYDFPADITACDNLNDEDYAPEGVRFWVVYNLFSTKTKHRLRLRAGLVMPDAGDTAKIDSVTPVWVGANWHERECYDMFGIVFEGHPDMRRILMPDDWEGHPLRKDYPVADQEPFQYINKQLANE